MAQSKSPRTVDIVYPICCGMDVHKNFIVACIAITDERNHTEHHLKRFSTFPKGLRELADWLKSYNCLDVCMESAGKYWIPIFNTLESAGLKGCLTHPKYVKAIKGKKTDKKDAKWIAELFKCDLVRSSFIPPFEIRQLRELCRYYVKLTYALSSEKNREQNCLTMCNFKLDDVFTDLSGASASRVIAKLLEHVNSDFEVAPLLDKHCKATVQDVVDVLDGELSLAETEKLKLVRLHKDYLNTLRNALESLILELARPFARQIEILLTVPGIKEPLTAVRILAEIGADMSTFESSKQLCSWAGLTPQNQESAGKKKTTRIGRAGAYLKPLLVQIVLAASKSTKHTEIKNKYDSLKNRRGGKKATIAIARRLLTAIYHMLAKNEAYNAMLYHKADKPPQNRVLTTEQALDFARRHGFLIATTLDSPLTTAT